MKLGRSFQILAMAALAATSARAAPPTPATAELVVHGDRPGPVMPPELQGQFAEHLGGGIYGGVWVGEGSPIANIKGYRKDVVQALQAIKVPVIRWPGGCFADQYHWRDGVGPRDKRPVRLNKVWGGVEEPNSFGTDEYMAFAQLVGAKTYIGVSAGSSSPQEMDQWVEYVTSDSQSTLANERRANGHQKGWKIDYLGVGNETWGCGGSMRPEYYADIYRQYATFVRPPGDKPIIKVASGANADDFKWTETLMAQAGDQLDAISLHNYVVPTGDWTHKGSATQFGEAEWIATLNGALKMDKLISQHSAVMDKYDPKKRVGLMVDEWGVWTDPEPGTNGAFLHQQNSLRDALAAAIDLDIFQAHADRVRMANIAQMVNVLQALILTDKDRMVLTPTYYVFDMYKVFQGATALPVEVSAPDYQFGQTKVPAVHASAGRDAAGVVYVALVNLDPNKPIVVDLRLAGVTASKVEGRVLTASSMAAINSFETPQAVRPIAFAGASLHGDKLTATLPAKSVVVISLR